MVFHQKFKEAEGGITTTKVFFNLNPITTFHSVDLWFIKVIDEGIFLVREVKRNRQNSLLIKLTKRHVDSRNIPRVCRRRDKRGHLSIII